MTEHPVLLYDGLCGFCDGIVQLLLRSDRRGTIRFAPLQGKFATRFRDRHPELLDIDSLILVEPGSEGERVYVRSDGALRVARHLGGLWGVARLLRVVPRPFRDAAYDTFARVRYRAFGRRQSCRIPTAEERARFLD